MGSLQERMNVNELRIGNLALKDGVVVTIDGRSIFDAWSSLHSYDPIELNPTWLEWLGLVKCVDEFLIQRAGNQYEHHDIYIINKDETVHHVHSWYGGSDQWEFAYMSDDCLKTVKYVHQLQNLHFALAETEIK